MESWFKYCICKVILNNVICTEKLYQNSISSKAVVEASAITYHSPCTVVTTPSFRSLSNSFSLKSRMQYTIAYMTPKIKAKSAIKAPIRFVSLLWSSLARSAAARARDPHIYMGSRVLAWSSLDYHFTNFPWNWLCYFMERIKFISCMYVCMYVCVYGWIFLSL